LETHENRAVAVLCNILGHGDTYDEWSTSFIIALSKMKEIAEIHVITPPQKKSNAYTYKLPDKCIIHGILDYDHPLSMIRAVNLISELECDLVIAVSGPTAFGRGSVSNLIGLLLPLMIQRKTGAEVKVINQGSTFTHETGLLGYSGPINSMKLLVASAIEKFIFKRVKTYFQLRYYCNVVEAKLGRSYVGGLLVSDYIDALATLYMNGSDMNAVLERHLPKDKINVLLHGFWGPQKDPETALRAVRDLKIRNPRIHLTVSGGINNHFPRYREYFQGIIKNNEDIIDRHLGYVEEKELMSLFLENDIVLMPYRASGGQSGVLEMASFFENIVVCSDFPEFREEMKSNRVVLTGLDGFGQSLSKALEMAKEIPLVINVQSKIQTVIDNIRTFLAD
jgi:glycosyltransferase involved in cell wall biosynthesis